MYNKKVIIVEGKTDKGQLLKVLAEQVDIICTYGTFSIERFDAWLDKYDLDHREVYIYVDADEAGIKLRKQLTAELSHAIHLYVPDISMELAETPLEQIALTLRKHHIQVKDYFNKK